MGMRIHIAVIRSIAMEYLLRLVKPYTVKISFFTLLLIGMVIYFAYFSSQWWLVLLLPIFMAVAIVAGVWLALLVASQRSRQNMNDEQRVAVKLFVTKIDQLTENLHTPHYILIFRITRDVLFRKKQVFIQQFTSSTGALKNDYDILKKLF